MARQFLIPGFGFFNAEAIKTFMLPGFGYFYDTESTTYNDSFTETITTGDSVTGNCTYPLTLSESLTMADALPGGVLVSFTTSDSITLADALPGGKLYSDSISNPITLSDSVAAGSLFSFSFTESININGVANQTVFYSSQYEASMYGRLEYADGGTTSGVIQVIDVPGTGYIKAAVTMPFSFTENVTPTDASSVGLIFSFPINENITLSDLLKLLTDFGDVVHTKLVGSVTRTTKLIGSV